MPKTIKEMSDELGISRTAVKNWVVIAGLDPATTVFSESDQAKMYEIKRLRDEKKTLEEIKSILGSVASPTTGSGGSDLLTQTILEYGIKPAILATIPLIPGAVAEVIRENLPALQQAFQTFRDIRAIELLEEDGNLAQLPASDESSPTND
jgi:DNA-binding transcriptional MerR regulator